MAHLITKTCSLILLLLLSCKTEVPSSDAANLIMPLGASRVEGARPAFESYRYDLWKTLIQNGWDIDFVGTNEDQASIYPPFQGQNFDIDHEGHGGFTSEQILDRIDNWLARIPKPDIVLLSSPGGNDALQGLPFDPIITNMNAIIDVIQEVNPKVIILIEQIAPIKTSATTPSLQNYLSRLQEEAITIADQQSDSTSLVIPVDMFTGFTDDFLADDVHYSEEGAAFIAQNYYARLKYLLE